MSLPLEEIDKKLRDSYELPNKAISKNPNPLVTVRTSVYQHGDYIAQCIEGVLMQKTNFPIEFIIGEDFSTDGSRELVFKYAEKYPEIIRVITADYNVGSVANGHRCMNASRGKYMAVCEGDDYWTDPNKLQKQVDILESNSDIVMVSHNANVFSEYSKKFIRKIIPFNSTGIIPSSIVVERRYGPLPMGSLLLRSELLKTYKEIGSSFSVGDYYLALTALMYGQIYHINEEMSVYRLNSGSWSGKKRASSFFIDLHKSHRKALDYYNKLTNNLYNTEIEFFFQKKTFELFANLIKTGLFKNILKHRDYLKRNYRYLNKKAYFKLAKIYIKTLVKKVLGKN